MNNQKLKAIANITRLQIINILHKAKEMNVSSLEKETGLSQSALSQHLAIMRQAGLVKTRRQAQQIFYSVAGSQTFPTAEMLLKW